jgi:anhydro-N-acetylmuramic acid kinase
MSATMTDLFIGLMSGTSLDGVDGVLVDFAYKPLHVVRHAHTPFPAALKQEFLALNRSGPDEINRAALAANALAGIYAQVVADLVAQSGVPAKDVKAIGAHGQTVRHRPQEFDGIGYTVQVQNAALLAELCNIDVVADFRSRDVAAGGQGAPLVPAFHREVFGRPDQAVAVLNLGGIANVTLIPPQTGVGADEVLGFDCGPGNTLMDHWCQLHAGQAFDEGGSWAASGQVNLDLLNTMLHEPYFAKQPPKSTGRDLFNAEWLCQYEARLASLASKDVMATLTELTARVCTVDVLRYQESSHSLIVCGGGALNHELMRRLQHHLPDMPVISSHNLGLPPLQVEATAFAWLARKTVRRETGNLPSATGAKKGTKKGADEGARILGAVYPA